MITCPKEIAVEKEDTFDKTNRKSTIKKVDFAKLSANIINPSIQVNKPKKNTVGVSKIDTSSISKVPYEIVTPKTPTLHRKSLNISSNIFYIYIYIYKKKN